MLLLSGRVSVPKPLSQIQRSTLRLLQGLSPRPSIGGFGLRQLHDKRNLDQDEVKVYAHLLNQSAQNMAYHVASGDDAITQYIYNATTNMIQQKWMDNPPDRTAEDILNNLKTQKDEEETNSRWEGFKNIFRRSADQDGD